MSQSNSKSSTAEVTPEMYETIRCRAEQIYQESGRIAGRDLENWTQAEREVLTALSRGHRRVLVVRVNGVQYFGEYLVASARDYSPGEFHEGSPVPVRFEGDKMYVRRPNGGELETVIVRKIS